MKNFICTLFVVVFIASGSFKATAQSIEDSQFQQNELKLNIVNTILIGSLEIGYEHFFDMNQSIGIGVTFMDRFAYASDRGEGQDFNATSVMVAYNYYFVSENDPSGFYVFPFLKYRGGTFLEDFGNNTTIETSLNSFIIGFGSGFKWVHNDKFALGPFISIARGFSDEVSDRFEPVEFNAGFTVGFRF
jgi:hypothetical protein